MRQIPVMILQQKVKYIPLTGAGNRLCVVSGASDVLICSCRHPESGSLPARNDGTNDPISTSIYRYIEYISM